MTRDDDRRRHLRQAQQALENAKGLLRTASDHLSLAFDHLTLVREDDRPPGEHQRNP